MRKYWVDSLTKMAEPILNDFLGEKHNMPRENVEEGKNVCYLEALGRIICGMAPWLEVKLPEGEEKELQKKFIDLSRRALANATNPNHPLYVNFTEHNQNLVDTAFLAQGLLRAPNALWHGLDDDVKNNIVKCMKMTRRIRPYYNNWICFSAIIEMFFHYIGEDDFDDTRVDYVIRTHEYHWYKGDGFYGDGESLAFNYYNSFVIQPILMDIFRIDKTKQWDRYKDGFLERASVCAHHLESVIMPDGTFPVVGRSSCYRYGAFHLLAQAMLYEDKTFSAGAVRAAMEAVIKKVQSAPDMYDENGFLTLGVYGHQPHMAEWYLNSGSAYFCSTVFLPLGLSPDADFWTEKDGDWTQKKIWQQ